MKNQKTKNKNKKHTSQPSKIESEQVKIAKAAKAAFQQSQLIPSSERVEALRYIRKELEAAKDEILAANAEDVKVRIFGRLWSTSTPIIQNLTDR